MKLSQGKQWVSWEGAHDSVKSDCLAREECVLRTGYDDDNGRGLTNDASMD